MKDFTINIIYIKGTVNPLLSFATSFLQYSECSYRLVSNACTPQEEDLLKLFTAANPRTSFYSMGVNNVLPHHEVLNHLVVMDQTECFAVMDSDIVVTKEFLPDLFSDLKDFDAIFSGLPIWHDELEMSMPEEFNIMGGRFAYAHNKFLLGGTYFAFYKRAPLINFMEETGLSFKRYKWSEIPETHRITLSALNLKKHFYDTGKVLNILWQHRGARMKYPEIEGLIHLGGISGETHARKNKNLKSRLAKYIPRKLKLYLRGILLSKSFFSIKEAENFDWLIKKRMITATMLDESIPGYVPRNQAPDRSCLPDKMITRIEEAIRAIKPVIENFNPEKTIKNVKTD